MATVEEARRVLDGLSSAIYDSGHASYCDCSREAIIGETIDWGGCTCGHDRAQDLVEQLERILSAL